MEGLSAKFAAERMTRAERFELARIHETAAEQLLQGEIDEYSALGRAFHALILEGSKNSTLVRITSELANRLIPYRRFQVTLEGGLQRNQDDHDIILAAIQAADAEAAYRAMRRHTQDQGDAVIASIPAFSAIGRGRESNREKSLPLNSGGTAL